MNPLKLTAKAQEYKYLYRFTPIPFGTKTNTIVGGYKWREYYKDGILDEKIQKQWELLESFDVDKGGIAIILGKARPRDGFDETNVFAIDLDGQSAVTAFCTREDGSVATLEELAQTFIVEWHDNDPTSIHIIGYSSKKLKNCKLITKPSPDKELREAIEVKADSLLINMSPSSHKGGGQWSRIVVGDGEEKIPDDDRKGLIEAHLINVFKRYGVDYTAQKPDYDPTSRDTEQEILSVIEMKQVKKGQVKGFGRIVAISEQYQAVSRIDAVCNGMVPCACDASEGEHERPCRYKLHVDYTVEGSRPPSPIILSAFDIGDGKPQICPRCKQPDNIHVNMDYRRAKLIQLQDTDNRVDNARQDVILYDEMVDNLTYNEIVQVEGKMIVERRPGSAKTSMMDNRLHAISVKYLKPKDVVITEADIKSFYRWKEICIEAEAREIEAVERFKQQAKQYDCVACQELARKIMPMSLVDRQAAAKAPNIIGHLPAKQGLLRSLVGGTNRGPGRLKGKINTLFIGDKGTAKSSIGDEALKIHPNSGKVTATHATGKAVTGIVDKDAKMLVLGILPASDCTTGRNRQTPSRRTG